MTEVIDTDNRDETTTTLILSNGDRVDVNPIELFRNMEQNCRPLKDRERGVIEDIREYVFDTPFIHQYVMDEIKSYGNVDMSNEELVCQFQVVIYQRLIASVISRDPE